MKVIVQREFLFSIDEFIRIFINRTKKQKAWGASQGSRKRKSRIEEAKFSNKISRKQFLGEHPVPCLVPLVVNFGSKNLDVF